MYRNLRLPRVIFAISLLLALIATGMAAPAGAEDQPRGQVTVIRDEYGVPHVYGSTLESLWYGVGYAQGQDRLWQAEVLRRTATGTSAEIFGPSAVAGDIFARTLFGSQDRRAVLFGSASPQTQTILNAYVAGMNAWIQDAAASGQLPVEYAVSGISPRPWTVDDSLAVAMLLFNNFGEFGGNELTNAAHLQELIARFGPLEGGIVFQDTHWLDDPSATTTVPGEAALGPARRGAAPLAELPMGIGQGVAEFDQAQAAWEANLARAGLKKGQASNALVIAPSLSADGHALLLGGPQMGYSVPQINHEMGVHGAGFDVTGMNIAGMPGLPIGVGKEHAWTMTSGISDNNDIYFEVLNPANPGQYLFQGVWRDYDCRVETIPVRGAPDVDQPVCESVHGPVVGGAPGLAFSLKSATRGLEVQAFDVIFGVMKARSLQTFEAAISQAMYNFNVLYADARGNIAYWHVGRIPIRAAGDNPWLPHDGTGGAEWQGFIPWEDMPHALNPEQGWLASWNNKPAPGWQNSTPGFGSFGPVHRVNTLVNLLEGVAPASATMQTVEMINRTAGWTTDTPSGNASFVVVSTLLDDMLARVDASADPRLPGITAMLADWNWLQVDADANGRYDNPAVAVFNTWWGAFSDRVFADDLGGALDRNVVGNLAARLLDDDPALPLLHNYLGAETVEQALTGSLMDALDTLTVVYSSADPAAWLQPVALIHWDPIGAGTVPDTIWMNRGTYNQIVHLGMGPQLFAQNVISPGQSGDPFSPHFADQLALYATWTYKPMRLARPDLVGYTESVVHLRP